MKNVNQLKLSFITKKNKKPRTFFSFLLTLVPNPVNDRIPKPSLKARVFQTLA